MEQRGKLEAQGEWATIRFERVYRHRMEHVWDAIATAEGLWGWLQATAVEIEGWVGGRFAMRSGAAQYWSEGRVLEWDPPRVLEYEWNVEPVAEMPRGERAVFRYELTAEGDGTRLRVVYRRLTRHTAGGFLPGLHAFLERLEAQLDGVEMPEWFGRFMALRAEYPEWRDGDAAGAGE